VRWLGAILPADVQIRAGQGSDTAWLTPADMRAVAAVAGVERTEFRRLTPLLLDPSRPAVTLIARDALPGSGREVLPLLRTAAGPAPPGVPPAWISEAMQDLYGAQPGARITLPLAGQRHEFFVAGVFRDYGRSSGAVVIGRDVYRQLARDERVNEGSVWLAPDHGAAVVIAAIRAALPRGDALDLLETTQVRDISLRIFDRAFLVTYALEAVAVIIGLLGVAFAASSTALARRAEFGMLRHLGLLRRQVLAMLAGEGLLTSLIGVLYGLALGMVLSLVLVYVINRQSFSWSVDLAVPWQQLVALSFALVIAAAVTATLAGRAVMGADSVRAVREDW
jgi:putative ABC transport system permease protein